MLKAEGITTLEWSFAALLLSPVCLGACQPPPDGEDIGDIGDAGSDYEELRTWTVYTSDEHPPLECPVGQALQGMDCTGSYCDNVALYCAYTGRMGSRSTWLPYFSEEGSGTADEGHCVSGDMWLTGVNCRGKYCDDLTMRCTQMVGSWTGTCWWSGWYSEEDAPFYASGGTFIKGIECEGDHCDNKRYRYCQML
jgi:hypothetical protein